MIMAIYVISGSLVMLLIVSWSLWKLLRDGRLPFGSGEVDIKREPIGYFLVLALCLSMEFFFFHLIWKAVYYTDWSKYSGGPCGIYCGQ